MDENQLRKTPINFFLRKHNRIIGTKHSKQADLPKNGEFLEDNLPTQTLHIHRASCHQTLWKYKQWHTLMAMHLKAYLKSIPITTLTYKAVGFAHSAWLPLAFYICVILKVFSIRRYPERLLNPIQSRCCI